MDCLKYYEFTFGPIDRNKAAVYNDYVRLDCHDFFEFYRFAMMRNYTD